MATAQANGTVGIASVNARAGDLVNEPGLAIRAPASRVGVEMIIAVHLDIIIGLDAAHSNSLSFEV